MKKGLNKAPSLDWSKGFTLIELLVVIAIIGILSGIVLTSLNTARTKAADTKVKAQLAGVRSQAEMYFDTTGSYGVETTDCSVGMFADPGINKLITIPNMPAGTVPTCNSTAEAWAVSANLSSGDYCVDSTGASVAISAPLAPSVTVCPAN